MRRRLFFLFLAFVAACVVAVATLPFWLGAAARIAGRSRGLTFSNYERLGYARFALEGVEFLSNNVRVAVSRVEAPTPVLWLWRHGRDQPNPIVAERWEVEVTPPAVPKPPTTEPGWMPLRSRLIRIAQQLDRWLPQAQTGPGVVRYPKGEVAVAAVKWADRVLTVTGLAFRGLKADASLAFTRDDMTMRLRGRTVDATTVLAVESRKAAVEGDITWIGQRARLEATFAPRGWLPEEASVVAAQWAVPGDRLKLGNLYAFVRGSAKVTWKEKRFAAYVNAAGEPADGKSAPPLKVDLRGEGDPQAFTVAALEATLPGITVTLDEPVTVERSGKLRGAGARLSIAAELAEQPWFAATGSVTGEARVESGASAMPVMEFTLAARDLTAKGVSLASVDLGGQLTWPQLQLVRGTIVAGEGERVELRGGWDFKTKEIPAARIEGQIRRQSMARWLPAQPEFDVVTISAEARGPIAQAQHTGRVQANGVKFRGINPLAAVASWRGRGVAAEQLDLEIKAGGSVVTLNGSVTRDGARVEALAFTQNGEPRLALVAPTVLQWRPAMQVEGLQLKGPQGTLSMSLTAGPRGQIELAAGNILSRWLTDFIPPQGPPWQLNLFALMGTWNRGPMNFSLTAGAAVELGEGRVAAVNAAARGDKDALRIEALRATEGDATVVNATGRLPITLTPGSSPVLHVDENGPIVLDATAAPNAAFWQKLAAVSGVELKEPNAVAAVKGTLWRPEGSVRLKAARVAIDPKKIARPLPAIEDIDVHVIGDRGGVTLERFAFSVEGQPVRARGRLPVPDDRWAELFKQPLAAARRGADFQLEVPEAEIAVFSRFLPAVLAPQGTIQANLGYKNGSFSGQVQLRGAASRPLGPLGVLQEISADLELSGRKLEFRSVQARSGGQPVTLTGTVELPEKGDPRFDLALKGENLPFVRQTGLLLRGDLDLKLQSPRSGPPRLAGAVRLRDSLFLADVRSFLPKGGASATRRPPYFSVDTPPMNTWVLAVEVTGEEFMRLRTPVFNGVASARFRLSGTLGEPRAIGEVEIDDGLVRMPFARFEVQQGSVRLTESDPYEPVIYLRATGRRYGYDLTMEIDGKASTPNVVFTSSPALESEEVLLMVMTGAAPSDQISVTGTQRVTRLGTFVGQSLISSFASDGADADRLSIASGEKISRQGKETYEIEYELSDRWTVTGEYNEYDEYNAGFKWRIFRGEPREESDEKR